MRLKKSLLLPLFACMAHLFLSVNPAGAANLPFLSFTVGDPGLPGDGILVTLDADISFMLSPPFALASATDGVTISVYPPGEFIFDGPEDFVSVLLADRTTGNTASIGFSPSGTTEINGVQGAFFNISQAQLELLVEIFNTVYGTNIELADLEIRGLSVASDFGNYFLLTLDAAAILLGQSAVPDFVPISIDIKPDSFPNSISVKSKGVVPVAILATTTFDPTSVDPSEVLFGASGNEASPVHVAWEDLNTDGNMDLILHFRVKETGLRCGMTSAFLTIKTAVGLFFRGSDSVRMVPCEGT